MEYITWGPHGHNVGFPSRIEHHESNDYVIKKYDVLDVIENTVRYVRYLLTHCGVRADAEPRSIRAWGSMHHPTTEWGGAEAELSEAA